MSQRKVSLRLKTLNRAITLVEQQIQHHRKILGETPGHQDGLAMILGKQIDEDQVVLEELKLAVENYGKRHHPANLGRRAARV